MTEQQARENLEFATFLETQVSVHNFNLCGWGHKSACGTVACIAGHRLLWPAHPLPHAWSGEFLVAQPESSPLVTPSVGTAAQRAMGLSERERSVLFHGNAETPQQAAGQLREIVYSYYPQLRS